MAYKEISLQRFVVHFSFVEIAIKVNFGADE
jgi:hypothetical protein